MTTNPRGEDTGSRSEVSGSADALAAMVNNAPSGMHFYELTEDGRLVFRGGNPAADRILGVDHAQFVGKTIEEAFPALASTQVPERYREAAAKGALWSMEQMEYHDSAISGAFEIHAFQTAPGQMVAVFSDITERKLAQSRLEAQRDLATSLGATDELTQALQLCLDAAISHSGADSGGVYVTDEAGALDLVVHRGLSDRFVRAVEHYDADAVEARAVQQGKPLYGGDAVPSEPRAQVLKQECIQSTAAIPILYGGNVVACMNVGARAPERFTAPARQWLEAVGVQIAGAIARLRGREDRRALEAQLQQAMKMEAIGRLAGSVAHDFNNILTAIGGSVSVALLDPQVTSDQRELLEGAMRAVATATDLTRRLLAFSRKQVISPRPVDLNVLLQDMDSMLRRLIGREIQLSVHPCSSPCVVVADPGQLEQIVLNLAVNARDAMASGGRLMIHVEPVELEEAQCQSSSGRKPGKYGRLTVTDTGSGMTDEVRQHLFEPFFTTKPAGRGTGLGLATTYGIVRQCGGFLDVQTEVGNGTSIAINLPLV